MTKINIMLDDGATLPTRAHEADAGLDIYSPKQWYVFGGESVVIDTGVHVQIPEGYVGFIKSRSGMNIKHSCCCEGVIDSGYTGSIKIKIYNHSTRLHKIEAGDRIAQLVIIPIATPEPFEVTCFDDTERGDGGFGSTGR